MFEKNSEPQQDEDSAAGKFCFRFVSGAEYIADLDTGGGYHESSDSDKGDCCDDMHFQEGKCDAYGQGIDARCDRKQKHRSDIKTVVLFLLLL